jgi:hypothetical protein
VCGSDGGVHASGASDADMHASGARCILNVRVGHAFRAWVKGFEV